MRAHVDCDQHGSVFTVTRPDQIQGKIWNRCGTWTAFVMHSQVIFQLPQYDDFQAALDKILSWEGGSITVH